KVSQHPGQEMTPTLGELIRRRRVIEDVSAFRIPEAEVDMGAVAGGFRPRLGRQRGVETVVPGDAADRLPQLDLVIRSAERLAVRDRDLVLAVRQLRVILLDRHPLRFQRRYYVVHETGRRGHGNAPDAE